MTRISTAICCAAALVCGPLQAAPVEWSVGSGGNGHWYELVSGTPVSWTEASSAAAGMTNLGRAGHLVTVTSAEEWAFLVDTVNPSGARAWLGGSDAASEGVWRWTGGAEAGETFWIGGRGGVAAGYHAWNPLEPNNASNEDYLAGWWTRDAWNDLGASWSLGAYVVEFTAAVPAPAALPLMLGGLGALAVGARRRRS
jgi:hypothetical protein